MKFFKILAAAFLLSTTAFADDFSLYYDATSSTTSTKIDAVDNLQKLTFENGTMTVIRKDGTTSTVSLSSIKKLFFSTEETVGIEDVKTENPATRKGEVYDLTGRKISIDLNSQLLSKGLYIIDGKKKLIR